MRRYIIVIIGLLFLSILSYGLVFSGGVESPEQFDSQPDITSEENPISTTPEDNSQVQNITAISDTDQYSIEQRLRLPRTEITKKSKTNGTEAIKTVSTQEGGVLQEVYRPDQPNSAKKADFVSQEIIETRFNWDAVILQSIRNNSNMEGESIETFYDSEFVTNFENTTVTDIQNTEEEFVFKTEGVAIVRDERVEYTSKITIEPQTFNSSLAPDWFT